MLIQQLVLIADPLGYTALELDQVQQQLSRFMTRKMEFSSADKAVFYKMPPFEWWSWIGIGEYPLVSLIARRVFTIPTSSPSAERGWSTHGRIHSDIRNSLGNEKAHMLAAIYTNHDDKQWESQLSLKRFSEISICGVEERTLFGIRTWRLIRKMKLWTTPTKTPRHARMMVVVLSGKKNGLKAATKTSVNRVMIQASHIQLKMQRVMKTCRFFKCGMMLPRIRTRLYSLAHHVEASRTSV
ncbi:hypothetical protein PR003_g21894 [Phytophthora rubi]|uniref:HAT C-terminal dimerisation domain-containing protein n=1 Tax=Phytophthora rubi TaxID=129364 RepID=A0A6A3NQI2_9STRA|nr:hypothetical protein PR002_g3126 [Phytophthora rubi]KAE9303890.1 hypothetical protein PR003_g21894 [Phytophthora rubi]